MENIKIITKDQAMVKIINYLNSRMKVMSRSETDEVVKLAIIHQISALELLTKYQELVLSNS
jgi:hypothetical protein